jgi:hypothetical protein
MNSSPGGVNYSRGQQFKFIPTEPVKPPTKNRVSNKAYSQISQLLGIQRKMQKIEEETCYPWQLDCEWTPQGQSGRRNEWSQVRDIGRPKMAWQ